MEGRAWKKLIVLGQWHLSQMNEYLWMGFAS